MLAGEGKSGHDPYRYQNFLSGEQLAVIAMMRVHADRLHFQAER